MNNQADIMRMAESDPDVGLIHKDQTLSGMIAMFPEKEKPAMNDVVGAMAVYVGEAIEVQKEALPSEPPVEWAYRIRVPGHNHDMVLWCAQATDQPPLEIFEGNKPDFQWVVGVDALLDYTDPLSSLADLIRMLVTATSRSTAILDLETNRWHGPGALASYFLNTQLEPPSEMLWLVQSSVNQDDSLFTLYTKGLARCGRRDLKIQGLHQSQLESAVQLLNAIAAQSVESPLSQPPTTVEIGHHAEVRLREPDTESEPKTDNAVPQEQRAALLMLDAVEETLPTNLLLQLTKGAAALWLPSRDQARRGQLARLTLPHFTEILMDEQSYQDATYLVQTSLTDGQAREYVWTNVTTQNEQGFVGELIEDPILECGPKGGDRMIISVEAAEDWRIEAGTTIIAPENIDLKLIADSTPPDLEGESQ